MSGNVWDFCLNEYEKPAKMDENGSELRSLRGGSYYIEPDSASVAARIAGIALDDFGLRVVCAASRSLSALNL